MWASCSVNLTGSSMVISFVAGSDCTKSSLAAKAVMVLLVMRVMGPVYFDDCMLSVLAV